jgi:putative colanic acid biosynthesis UDP-glucose lipid carrier transferase
MKRAADILLSILLLVLLSPFLLVIAAGVKLSSPGPVLLKQRRVGAQGGEIMSYAFRTRTVLLRGNYRAQAQWNGSRVTHFGAFLRRTSLDVVPQLLNVLDGTMSIVARGGARRTLSSVEFG